MYNSIPICLKCRPNAQIKNIKLLTKFKKILAQHTHFINVGYKFGKSMPVNVHVAAVLLCHISK